MSGKFTAKHPYERVDRANKLVMVVLAEAIEKLLDSRDGETRLTITQVRVSKDFSKAKVCFDTLSQEDLEFLESERTKLRSILASSVKWKKIPTLEFCKDPAIEAVKSIDATLLRLKREGRL